MFSFCKLLFIIMWVVKISNLNSAYWRRLCLASFESFLQLMFAVLLSIYIHTKYYSVDWYSLLTIRSNYHKMDYPSHMLFYLLNLISCVFSLVEFHIFLRLIAPAELEGLLLSHPEIIWTLCFVVGPRDGKSWTRFIISLAWLTNKYKSAMPSIGLNI